MVLAGLQRRYKEDTCLIVRVGKFLFLFARLLSELAGQMNCLMGGRQVSSDLG